MIDGIVRERAVRRDRRKVHEPLHRRRAEREIEYAVGAVDVPVPLGRAVAVHFADLPRGMHHNVRLICAHLLLPAGIRHVLLYKYELPVIAHPFRPQLLVESDDPLHVVAFGELLHEHRTHIACRTGDEKCVFLHKKINTVRGLTDKRRDATK